jgi:hypothetical protein
MLGFRVFRSIPELPGERFPVPNVIPEFMESPFE